MVQLEAWSDAHGDLALLAYVGSGLPCSPFLATADCTVRLEELAIWSDVSASREVPLSEAIYWRLRQRISHLCCFLSC